MYVTAQLHFNAPDISTGFQNNAVFKSRLFSIGKKKYHINSRINFFVGNFFVSSCFFLQRSIGMISSCLFFCNDFRIWICIQPLYCYGFVCLYCFCCNIFRLHPFSFHCFFLFFLRLLYFSLQLDKSFWRKQNRHSQSFVTIFYFPHLAIAGKRFTVLAFVFNKAGGSSAEQISFGMKDIGRR